MKKLIVLFAAAALSAASLSAGNKDFKSFMRRPDSGTHAVLFNTAGYGWNIGIDQPSSNVSLRSRFLSDMFWDLAGIKSYSKSGVFNFYTGIGLGYSSYRADSRGSFQYHNPMPNDFFFGKPLYYNTSPQGEYKLSALRNFYLYIPADFNFNVARKVTIFAGVQGEFNFRGWLVNERRVSRPSYEWSRSKTEGLMTRQFTYSVKAGMMFGHFGFYLKCRPISMYTEDYGPQFQTMSIGFIFR